MSHYSLRFLGAILAAGLPASLPSTVLAADAESAAVDALRRLGAVVSPLGDQKWTVEYGGGLRFYAEIDAGATRMQKTFSEATWLIADENASALGYFVSTLKPSRAVIPAR